MELFRTATRRLPSRLHYGRGLVHYRRGEWRKAQEIFEQACTADAEHADSHFKLGMCLFRQGDYAAAREAMEAAMQLAPERIQWRKQHAQVVRHLENGTNNAPAREARLRERLEREFDSALLHSELAESLNQQRKWWQEVEALRHAVALDSGNASLQHRLGCALEKMSKFTEAAACFEQALRLDGHSKALRLYLMGRCYESAATATGGSTRAATEAYRRAIAADTKLGAARFGVGVFHQKEGLWHRAAAAFASRSATSPVDAELRWKEGMAHDRCYEWSRAEACYREALALDLDRPEWHFRLGLVLERQGRFRDAAASYQYASLKRSKHTPYWFYRWGYCLAKAGELEAAACAYRQGEQEPPPASEEASALATSSPTPESTAQELAAQEQYEGQFSGDPLLAYLKRALELDCSEAEVWHRMGSVHEQQGRWLEAAECFEAAIARGVDHTPQWHYRLGFVLSQAGRFEEACDAFRCSRVLQTPHGTSEAVLNTQPRLRDLVYYAEYYETTPLREKTILFESFNGASLTCNPYALFRHMYFSGQYDDWLYVWVVNDRERVPSELRSRRNIVFVPKNSDRYMYYLCCASHLVNNSGFPPYFVRKPEQKYLATWHGTPLKTLGKEQKYKFLDHKRTTRNFLQATHIISPNPHTTEILFDSYDIRSTFAGALAQTGYPRIDLTVNCTAERRAQMRAQLGLVEGVPVVLYAPTWRGTLQEADLDVSRLVRDIRDLSGSNRQIIFRGHSLVETALASVELGCTVVPTDIDSNELLSIVDVLITDYSSIFFDYIPLNRPIIYYTYDLKEYEEERGLYFSMADMPGYHCEDIVGLRRVLQEALTSEAVGLPGYQESRGRFNPHDDGGAAQRVLEFLLEDQPDHVVDPGVPQGRRNVLLYPGALEPNGITTSFINLVGGLDTERVNPVVALSPSNIEASPQSMEQFCRLDYGLDFIPRYGNVVMTLEERYLRTRADRLHYAQVSEEEWQLLRRMYAREYRRIMGDSRIDVAVHFSGYDEFWAKVLAAADGTKRVVYLHNDLYAEHRARFPYLQANFRLYRDYDKLVSVSEMTCGLNRGNLSRRFGVDPEKFIFCDNVQNPQQILARAEEPLPECCERTFSGGDSTVFVSVGRLSIEKDHAKLIRAFAAVRKKHPRSRLLILGQGPLRQELLRLCETLRLGSGVSLPGNVPNPFPVLKRADCFVLSSNHEGQPMVLFEAMILGMPIVATDIIGTRSALEGRSGHLVENSEEGLVAGMLAFLEGKVHGEEFDVETYQRNALEMFYQKVCDA